MRVAMSKYLDFRFYQPTSTDGSSNTSITWLNRIPLTASKQPSCAIVGSGSMLYGRRFGTYIDAHDLVIRVNRLPLTGNMSVDIGNRTDVWFSKLCRVKVKGLEFQVIGKTGVYQQCSYAGWLRDRQICPFKAFVFRYAHGTGVGKIDSCRKNLRYVNRAAARADFAIGEERADTFKAAFRIAPNPTTGLHAVLTSRSLCASISLFGFSGNGHPLKNHEIEKEHQVLRKMARDDLLTIVC
jgi:hypothetical protein